MIVTDASELAVRVPLMDFISAYQRAMQEMTAGFEQARRARLTLENLIEQGGAFDTADHRIRDLQKTETAYMRRRAWDFVLAQLGVDKILSSKRQKEMYANLGGEGAPELSAETALEIMRLIQENDLAREVILEAFDELRPGKWSGDRYKTNAKAWRVNSKVILRMAVEKFWGQWRVAYRNEAALATIDRAFHLLDGNLAECDTNAYRTPLVDAIQTSTDGRGETKYFRFRCFANGNLHLQIKRLDLLRELNRIGGEGRAEIGGGA
ncbi:MAG: DUF4942 domain-containing protein [Chloroflexota bacterium]